MVKLKVEDEYIEVDENLSDDEIDTFEKKEVYDDTIELDLGELKDE